MFVARKSPEKIRFNFDLPKIVFNIMKTETEFITRANRTLAGQKIKKETERLLPNIKHKHGDNIYEHKTKEQHKFVLNLSLRLNLRSSKNMLHFKTDLFIKSGKI